MSEKCPREHSRRLTFPVQGSPKEALRYLFFRLREFWPTCHLLDSEGDTYSPTASYLPTESSICPDQDSLLTYQVFKRLPNKIIVKVRKDHIELETDDVCRPGLNYLAQLPLVREKATVEA